MLKTLLYCNINVMLQTQSNTEDAVCVEREDLKGKEVLPNVKQHLVPRS